MMTIIPVTINKINQASSTVRIVEIGLKNQYFEYKAGQWIDCYAELNGERKLVGYSLASSPSTKGTLELAVKISDNPVSEYIHTYAQPGDILFIEGGQGDVFYEEEMGNNVVLIGAGIGIAPLMGIFRYIAYGANSKALLVQSASTMDELIYFHEITNLIKYNEKLSYYPTVTKENLDGINYGRITGELINSFNVSFDALYYLSGPGIMIPELCETLHAMGVPKNNIKYEVWWKTDH